MNKLLKHLEEKFGMKPKVKTGKPYPDMDRAAPSHTMKIYVTLQDGTYIEVLRNLLTEPGLDMGKVEGIFFVYLGPTWLTVNAYSVNGMITAAPKAEFTPEQRKGKKTYEQLVNEHKPAIKKHRVAQVEERNSLLKQVDDDADDVPW